MTAISADQIPDNLREYQVAHTFNRNFINQLNKMHRQYGDTVFEVLGIANRNLDIALFSEEFFSNSASNVADISVDDNANISDKNISHYESESTKALQKLNSLATMYNWVEKCFDKKKADVALEKFLNGEIFINDMTKFNFAYCFAFDLRNLLFEGMSFFKGGFKINPPKRSDSFIALMIQTISFVSNQIAGACMHPEQEVLIKQTNGKIFYVKSKDLYDSVIDEELSFNTQKDVWITKQVSDIKIWENQKFVDLKRVYKRHYSDKIYKISTASGKKLRVSKDHLFKVLYRKREIEVKAENLQCYDTLVNTGMFKVEKDIHSFDYRTGQMLGVLCGDGCLTDPTYISVSINAKQLFIAEFLDAYFEEFFGKKGCLRKDKRGNVYDWRFHSVEVRNNIINTYFLDPSKLKTKDKNIRVLNKTLNFKMGFLDGMLVTDGTWGHTFRINLTNFELIKTLASILQELGVETTQSYTNYEKQGWSQQLNLFIPSRASEFLSLMNLRYQNYPRYKSIQAKDKEYVSISYLQKGALETSALYQKKYTPLLGNIRGVWHDTEKYLLDVVTSIEIEENFNNFVYEVETETGWYSCGGILTHNCSFPDFFVAYDYFLKKEFGPRYLENTESLSKIKNQFQNFIYSVNFPFRNQSQSPFVNLSVLDKGFMKALFTREGLSGQDYIYPDNSKVDVDSVIDLSKKFFEYFSEINSKEGIFTFPVMTLAISKNTNGSYYDEDFANWVCNANSKKGLGNVYIDEPTSFSSCCRLRNDLTKISSLGYQNSFGVGSLGVGSHRCVGINLPRLALLEKTNPTQMEETLEVVHDILYSHRKLIEKNIKSGTLPLYNTGWISLKRQYSTVGFVGLYEYFKNMGVENDIEFFTTKGVEFLQKIESKIVSWQEKEGTIWNCEQIPAESQAVKLCQLDTILGFNPNNFKIYSNQYLPLWEEMSIYDRFKLQGTFDSLTSGGAILHINVQDEKPLSEKQYYSLLEQARQSGTKYFAINLAFSECPNSHYATGRHNTCPACGEKIVNQYTRVVGYLSKVSAWNKVRRTEDYPNRHFYTNGKLAALEHEE